MQKGGGCKTDWRWEGKCSSPGGCCKGGRRKSRRKGGYGTPKTLQKKRANKKHKTLTEKKHRTIMEKKRRTIMEKKRRTIMEKKERPPSGRTVSTESGRSLNTAFGESLDHLASRKTPPDPRHQLQAIIGAGGQGQTDDEYTQRIAALLAADGGTAPRIIAQESSPDMLEYHRATTGEDLGGNKTFGDVLMRPKLREWERGVKNDEAKKQFWKDLKLKPIPQRPKRIAVIREQYGGRKRRTRRRKRSRYGGNNNLQIEDDFVKYHDFLNKRLPEGLLAPRWRPGELASHTVISPDSNRPTIKKKSRKPPPLPLRARREAQARRAATIPIGDFGGNHFDLERPAGKKAAKKAARRQRLKRRAAENAAASGQKKKTSRRQFSPQEKRLIAAGAPEGGRRRRTRRRKRRGGETANNVRGKKVSEFNRAQAIKEFGPAKKGRQYGSTTITPETIAKFNAHKASLKPKDWRNMYGLFGGRRTRKQRGGEIEKLTATDMMRNSSTILGHKINEIIDDVNELTKLPPPKVKSATKTSGGRRTTRRNRRRRRKKRRKSAR